MGFGFTRSLLKPGSSLSNASIALISYRMWGFGFQEPYSIKSVSLLARMLFGVGENKLTCGVESMSRLQEHIFPSVETVMRLWAFWVPTTFTQYTGCCENVNTQDQPQSQEEVLTFESQTHYCTARIKEWHNSTRTQASSHLPLLIWTWFLSESSGSNTGQWEYLQSFTLFIETRC